MAPTQSQTFPLNTTHTFWEVFAPLNLDPSVAHGNDYRAAVAASHADLDARVSAAQMHDTLAFLESLQDTAPSRLLWRGGPWGALHELVLKAADPHSPSPFSPGTPFDLTTAKQHGATPWLELLANGTFSARTLRQSPLSWAVDDKWVRLLQASARQHERTWLHDLHLAVNAHHRGNTDAAAKVGGMGSCVLRGACNGIVLVGVVRV